MKTTPFILLIFFSFITSGQKVIQPKDIHEAIQILDRDCPDSLKLLIKKSGNDTITNIIHPWGYNVKAYETISDWTSAWDSKEKTDIEKYYADKGITYSSHIESIILISFKKFLNNDTINHEQIIKPFQIIEEKWNNEDKVRFTTDSLRGVYIPKDIEECIIQIDRFWSDSTKAKVKQWTEREFCGKAHFGFGMWMRNNWQLWAGSRLSKYFNDLGIFHPDDMSSIILTSYYRHLKKKKVNLAGQIKEYQEYWKKAQKKSEQDEKKGNTASQKSGEWLKKNNVPINKIIYPDGRQVMYPCDSSIVMKKIVGDTIIFWTSGSMTPMEISEAEKEIKDKDFGRDTYVSGISDDGRIDFTTLHTTKFQIVNDSLFELEEHSNSTFLDSTFELMLNKPENMSEKELNAKMDKLWAAYDRSKTYTFKLVFHCSMFANGNDTFAISLDTSKHADVIQLEGCWQVNEKLYYRVRIRNNFEGTTYAFFFDDTYRFWMWEGCLSEEIKQLTEKNRIYKTTCK